MKMKKRFLAPMAAALMLLGDARPALADPPSAPHPDLRHDTAADLVITGAGGILWISSELLKAQLGPSACRWCDRHADGSDALNAVDATTRDALRWSNPSTADALSYGTGFVLAPIAAFGLDAVAAGHDGRADGFAVDAMVILEAAVIAADVNQIVKFSAGRERPFVHALPPDAKSRTSQPSDNNVSFFSGHTTLAFSLATASGTVASMRGYRLAPLVWGVGMGFAATTGYLRIAGDKHYLTDVVTAAIVGSGIGFAVPYLFHAPRAESSPVAGVASSPQSTQLVIAGAF